jgi:hypothetical protein
VAVITETHLKTHERFFISNYDFYRTNHFQGRKGGTAVAVRKGIRHNHADLPPLASIEVTEVCVPICNREMLLAAVCKSPGHVWNDADIIDLLSIRRKSLQADLNAKHPFWNGVFSSPSGAKLLNLLHINGSRMSAPLCPTLYSPAETVK